MVALTEDGSHPYNIVKEYFAAWAAMDNIMHVEGATGAIHVKQHIMPFGWQWQRDALLKCIGKYSPTAPSGVQRTLHQVRLGTCCWVFISQ
jgi:hypothetical protein